MRCHFRPSMCLLAAIFGCIGLTARGQDQAQASCSASTAVTNAANLGDACGAIISDPKASTDARVEALLYRGLWHDRGKRITAAARDYDRALQLAPDHPQLLQLRGSISWTLGNLANARRLAERSAELDPTRSKTFELLGRIAYSEGHDDKALGYLHRAIELNSGNIYARYERAVLLRWVERPAEALSDTEWLIAQQPSVVDAEGTALVEGHVVPLYLASQIVHAKTLRQLDRYADAEAYFAELIVSQRTSFTLTQRSRFLRSLPASGKRQNRQHEALADAEEAVRLDPHDARAQLQLATLLEDMQRYDEALAAVDRALQYEELDSWIPAATWIDARVLRALGKTDEAIAAARQSLRVAWEVNRTFLMDRLDRLQRLGYWLEPPSKEKFAAALDDAAAACMEDDRCK